MDVLFSVQELSSNCYQQAGRGTSSDRDKPTLSPRHMKCMEGAYIFPGCMVIVQILSQIAQRKKLGKNLRPKMWK